MNLVPYRFALQILHTGSIDVLSHTGILSQYWEVMQDFIINCVQDSLFWLSGDVL